MQMQIREGEDEEQEMKWQAQVWNHIAVGFVDSIVLKCAIDLAIFDTIHTLGIQKQGKPKITLATLTTSPQLSSIKSHKLYRLLRYLVHKNLLAIEVVDGEEIFSITELAKFLLRDDEKSLVDFALGVLHKPAISAWHQLSDSISCQSEGTTARTPFEKEHGKSLWEFARDNPEMNKVLNDAMASDTRFFMPAFVEGCKGILKEIESLVDVGGGTCTAMSYVVKAFPHIKCTVFDLPHVIATASPEHLLDGVEMVGGDMFQFIPPADAVLLKFMLHNWQNEGCVEILKKCKEAVPRDKGKVIIIDIAIDQDEEDDDRTQMKLCLDIDMMATSGGRERTKEEWRVLMEIAGFSRYEIIPIFAVQSVIVAYP